MVICFSDFIVNNSSMDCIETAAAFAFDNEVRVIDDRPVVTAVYHGKLALRPPEQNRNRAACLNDRTRSVGAQG